MGGEAKIDGCAEGGGGGSESSGIGTRSAYYVGGKEHAARYKESGTDEEGRSCETGGSLGKGKDKRTGRGVAAIFVDPDADQEALRLLPSTAALGRGV